MIEGRDEILEAAVKHLQKTVKSKAVTRHRAQVLEIGPYGTFPLRSKLLQRSAQKL
jgi:hypothetical protein